MLKPGGTERSFLILIFAVLASAATTLSAGDEFVLSTHADYSTDDRIFTRDDTLFMKVMVPNIDYTEIEQNEFRLHASSGPGNFEGKFSNHLDGTFTARLSLKTADASESSWEWRGRIRDRQGREFEAEVNIQIVGSVDGEIEVVLRGKIEGLGADFVVVQNTTILVNASTEIVNENGQALAFADLHVGQSVKVSAVRNENGHLLAHRIKFMSRSENELELKGVIENIGENTLVVLGLTFTVDSNTEILNHDNDPISLTELSVGQLVEIKAKIQSAGSRQALRIRVEDHSANEVELRGKIESLGVHDLVVNGVTFAVTANTEILGDENQPIAFVDLHVGLLVEVKGFLTEGGTAMAIRIKVAGEIFDDDEVELIGLVSEVGIDFIAVSGLRFAVSTTTVILDDNNHPVALADIKAGVFVEIRADVAADGSLQATHIKVEDRFEDAVEFTGEITSIDENALSVDGKAFVINENTVVLDNHNQPILFAELEVGMFVEVRGDLQMNGSLLATHIKIEDRIDDEVELTGRIDDIAGETLVVAGFAFQVNASTVILDNNRNVISFAGLHVGLIVEIRADVQLDGTLLATHIKIEDHIADEVEVTGVIDALTETVVVVSNLTFRFTANTILLDHNLHPVALAALAVGQRVEVKADLLADGTLIALRVKLEDGFPNELEVEGPISAIGLGGLVVLQNEFIINLNTQILDLTRLPLALEDLLVGQTVKIRGILEINRTRVATQIQLKSIVVMSGAVAQVNANSIVILGKVMNVDANTLILGEQNRAIAFTDLKAGDRVEVRGESQENDQVNATKIKSQQPNIITGIADESDPGFNLPVQVALQQNYPNPFNPSTNISYSLARDGRVSLTVYNVLGQKVASLVDDIRPAGNYTITWDAANISSGIYLYRLEAGASVVSRMMTLVK